MFGCCAKKSRSNAAKHGKKNRNPEKQEIQGWIVGMVGSFIACYLVRYQSYSKIPGYIYDDSTVVGSHTKAAITYPGKASRSKIL